jgi:hypothetical protein
MGAAASSPEDVLKVAAEPANYSPSLEVNPANALVYFDLQLGRYGDATPLGRVVMELKEDTTPKTVSGGVFGAPLPAHSFRTQTLRCTLGEGEGGGDYYPIIPKS